MKFSDSERREMELEHPFHDHPLIFSDQNHHDRLLICDGCAAPILSGPLFICSAAQNCKFCLHTSCAELQMQITHHSLHNQHNLNLHPKSLYEDSNAVCDDCDNPIFGFVYHCSICKFDLHVTCAAFTSLVQEEKRKVEIEIDLFEHPLHEHPLIPFEKNNEDERVACSGCGDPIRSAPFFICSHQFCRFAFHKSCALLPKKITHFLHTQHPLTLHGETPCKSYRQCDNCDDPITRFFYHCLSCKFDFDIKCAQLVQDVKCLFSEVDSISRCNLATEKEIEMELRHPFHDHHLLILSQKTSDVEKQFCNGCTAPILLGPFFRCSQQQCYFYLHKHCANLPKEITHFLHKKHPLTLLKKNPYLPQYPHCDACGGSITGFLYHCSSCGYELDTVCASSRRFLDGEDHEHSFMFLKSTLFTCDICGKLSDDKSYVCIMCQVQIHQKCASLPRAAKVFCHMHPLELTFGFQLEKPIDVIQQFCRICRAKVDIEYGFYYCASCTYFVDVKCGTSEPYKDCISHTEGEVGFQSLHSHGLILCTDQATPAEVCDVCLSTIATPFYKCEENCGYLLHELCRNLPERINHPLHQSHTLLFSSHPDTDDLICDACGLHFNGFFYHCVEEECSCFSKIDLKCGMRSQIFHTERAHEHPLYLIAEGADGDRMCIGCGSECNRAKYRCTDCDYNLCFRCVGLPASAKHKKDKHPLALTYESISHEYGEYYCDQCEKPRDPNHWFYHCESCNRDVHPACMKLHNYNLKITYEREEHPHHRLRLAVNHKETPSCASCGYPCKSEFLQCVDCKFYIHFPQCGM